MALFALHVMLGFGQTSLALKLEGKLLDEINYRAVTLGYPLYTLGALFAGAIWAEQAWGAFWSWDPKEVGALIIWLFYSAFLHARYQRGWSRHAHGDAVPDRLRDDDALVLRQLLLRRPALVRMRCKAMSG